MLSDAKTPEDYLAQLPDDWRRDTLLELRQMALAAGPDLTETMHYRMLGYGIGDDFAFHLNVQKGYVSLYVGNAAEIDPEGALLEGLNVGKGCIRFTKTKVPQETQIAAFLAEAYAHWKTSGRSGC